ncbi:MAG: ParB N-terminal domain-containing protein [Lachnospiraceae bacterium]
MRLKIKDINIGQRIRDEYGDMESLANSIKEHGLLHPIVVDSDYNLIAGGRRLLACERAGFAEIEAKVLENISERELRVLELEENIRRKDLTELEKSKNLVELAEIKEQELKGKAETDSFHGVREKSGGRAESAHLNDSNVGKCSESEHLNNPNKIGVRTVAKEIGVAPITLHDAKQHVAAVEEFPALAEFPKYKAIETAKELRQAPPEEQEKILDFAQRKTQTLSAQKEDDYYSYIDECSKMSKKYLKAVYAFLYIKADEKEFKMISETMMDSFDESLLREIDDSIGKLSRLRNFVKGVLNGEKNKEIRT